MKADVLVLCYHAVSERWPAELSVTPQALEAQLGLLVARGYRGFGFLDATSAPPSGRVVAVTFDDAFRSVAELALPVLERLGLTATLFVPTDFVGRPGPMSWPGIDRWVGTPYERELACLDWEDLRALQDAGWEIGSHSCSHPRLTELAEAALAHELEDSRRRLEDELGRPCRSLAYPYGDVDERVVRAAGAAGYAAAGTLPNRLHRPEPLAWPRMGIWHDDEELSYRAKVSPTLRRLRASPLWALLDASRRKLTGRRRTPRPPRPGLRG